MIQRQDGLFVTGAAGNGKSTLLRLLRDYIWPEEFKKGSMHYVEMSGIIGSQSSDNTSVGKLIRSYRSMIDDGFYLPDDAAIPAFKSWFEENVATCPTPKLWLIGGAPRTVAQKCFLEMFFSSKVVHIIVDEETSKASILKRMEESDPKNRRVDDRPEAVNTRWNEYQKTMELMDILNGEVIRMDRRHPMLQRIKYLLGELRREEKYTLYKGHAKHAMNEIISDHQHPLRKAIEEIEGPSEKDAGVMEYNKPFTGINVSAFSTSPSAA